MASETREVYTIGNGRRQQTGYAWLVREAGRFSDTSDGYDSQRPWTDIDSHHARNRNCKVQHYIRLAGIKSNLNAGHFVYTYCFLQMFFLSQQHQQTAIAKDPMPSDHRRNPTQELTIHPCRPSLKTSSMKVWETLDTFYIILPQNRIRTTLWDMSHLCLRLYSLAHSCIVGLHFAEVVTGTEHRLEIAPTSAEHKHLESSQIIEEPSHAKHRTQFWLRKSLI